jgi:catechol 2,3-dioxygenase
MSVLPNVQFRHLGVHTTDLDSMVQFYCETLGFVCSDQGVASFGNRIVFLTQTDSEHHQLVLLDGRPPDAAFNPINQISFRLDSLGDLRRFHHVLVEREIHDLMPVDHGNAWSLYFHDPEGNFLELYVDTPYYTSQPCRAPLDLTLPEDEIRQRNEELCRSRPGFATQHEWREKIGERIATARGGSGVTP